MPADTLPTQTAPAPVSSSSTWAAVRSRARLAGQRLPGLWIGGWIALALSVPLALLGWFDDRLLLGISVWVKPWKFHVSLALHLLTLAWLATYLRDTPERARSLKRLSGVALASGFFEVAYITWRASRGEASHFNVGTPLAGLLYSLMGLGAVLLTGCAGVLGLWIARARDFAYGPVLQRGLATGLLLGWLLGTLSGAYVAGQTGHGVGGSLGDASGLPVFRWLRDGGDLRVAHFFGLHAMQVIPLLTWAAARWLQPRVALRGLAAFAAVYTAFTVFTFAQAVAGLPFL